MLPDWIFVHYSGICSLIRVGKSCEGPTIWPIANFEVWEANLDSLATSRFMNMEMLENKSHDEAEVLELFRQELLAESVQLQVRRLEWGCQTDEEAGDAGHRWQKRS